MNEVITMLISNSTSNVSYKYSIRSKQEQEQLNDISDSWIQFLQDHTAKIKENSTKVKVTEELMTRYQYRPRMYLKESGGTIGIELAFRIVNRIYTDLDFTTNLANIYIPDSAYITELYRMYSILDAQISAM
jgi:hypothetical protein